MSTLKHKTETFIVVELNDMNTFIREATGVKDYDFMSAEEGPKDNYHSIMVDDKPADYQLDFYNKFLLGKMHSFVTKAILTKLCKDGLVPAGHYLIACFW